MDTYPRPGSRRQDGGGPTHPLCTSKVDHPGKLVKVLGHGKVTTVCSVIEEK